MKLFNFFKRDTKEAPEIDYEHLDSDGELPWGWVFHYREFTDKIQNEFSYFLNLWLESRKSNVRLEREALISLIRYIEDGQKLCKSKGECYSKWFSNCIASDDYLQKRKKDLEFINEHFDEFVTQEVARANVLPHLKDDLIRIIQNNPGILQTEIYKRFDPLAKSDVSEKLYFMAKEKLIRREKSGTTYSVFMI